MPSVDGGDNMLKHCPVSNGGDAPVFRTVTHAGLLLQAAAKAAYFCFGGVACSLFHAYEYGSDRSFQHPGKEKFLKCVQLDVDRILILCHNIYGFV